MKKIIKVLSINLTVLLALLVILEIILRLAGMETIVETEKKDPAWNNRYKYVCKKILKQDVKVFDSFYTDSEGIFKAKYEYFADPSKNRDRNISINSSGFRGNPFEYIKTSRKKILLIGDSFTWGASAEPITNSFADLLQKAGYHIYNAGIPGTDPQQYAMIADKYIAKLKPDVVAVCIYLGNDVSTRPLLIEPNRNLHYVTNHGYLLGYDHNGRFFKNAQEAFEYMKKRRCGYLSGPGDYLIYETVLGKAIENLIFRKNKNHKFDGTKKWVKDSLYSIRNACDKNGVKCIYFLIPFVHQDVQDNKAIRKNLYLFEDMSYYYPTNMGKADYCKPPNNHFNNQGHRKYADFMINVLKQNAFDAGT